MGRPHDWQNRTSSGRFFPHWPQNTQFPPSSVCESSPMVILVLERYGLQVTKVMLGKAFRKLIGPRFPDGI